MELFEQIKEQANAINGVASSAYQEGYKRGYEDAKREMENFLDNTDKASEREADLEAVNN